MQNPQHVDLLVVDDDAEFRDTLVRRYGRQGYQVRNRPMAYRPWRCAKRREFAVAVVDMVMPGLSGLEDAREAQGGPW